MSKIRLRQLLKWAFLASLGLLVAGIGYNFILPGISYLKNRAPGTTAFMKYRRAMAEKAGKSLTINRRWVPLASISPYLVQAVIICEDDKFWSHHGFDFQAIKVAVEKDIKEKSYRFGGSTITQQLAKNLFLSPSKNPVRKLREFILTWRLERTLSKKRILELYLNEVEWGSGIFGAEAAAEHYYGKPAAELSPEEAAHLAVILPSPRRYNPVGGTKYVEDRVSEVLEIMAKRGIIRPAGPEQ
jgi:monofunctional biosynthetic peptidoglycan transglycosylase